MPEIERCLRGKMPKLNQEFQDTTNELKEEVKQCRAALAERNYDKYIIRSLEEQYHEEKSKLDHTNQRMQKELYKKNLEIKRLQSDLHHYYNKRRK